LSVDPHCDHRWGLPCCLWSPLPTCHRHYPGRLDGTDSLVLLPSPRRPSPISRWVGSCINRFQACSAFPHGTACTLAESPSHPFHRKLRQLRFLRCRFDCYRVERTSSRAGLAPAEVQRLFTAHVIWRFIANELLACVSLLFPKSKAAFAAVPRTEGGLPPVLAPATCVCPLSAWPLTHLEEHWTE
jgi:hypothetical protein